MGVGVEAPGRDHHPMTLPQNQQSHNMTNGYNGDHHATGNMVNLCLTLIIFILKSKNSALKPSINFLFLFCNVIQAKISTMVKKVLL